MKLTKEEFHKLGDDNLTKKEERKILEKINGRFDYIVKKIFEAEGCRLKWYDYGEDVFCYNVYKDWTCFVGEADGDYLKYYHDGFPSEWFYEDFEDNLKLNIEKFKQEEKDKKEKERQKRLERKIIKERMIENISNKLNAEELKWFKKNIKT